MLQRACRKNPASFWAWDRLGRLYRDRGDVKRRIAVYEEAVKNNGSNSWLWARLANVYIENCEYSAAIKTLETAIERLKPGATWLWQRLARAYERAGDLDKAMALCKQNISTNGWFEPLSCVMLGEILAKGRDYEAAIKLFMDVIVTHPAASWAWEGLGKSYRGSHDFSTAKEALKKAIECDPGAAYPWFSLAEIYESQSDYIGAVSVYRAAIRQIPSDYFLDKRLGDAFRLGGDYENAITAYMNSIKKGPNGFLSSYLQIPESRFYPLSNEISIGQDMVEHFPWYHLGKAYESNNQREKAIEVYEKASIEYRAAIEGRSNRDLLWHYTSFPCEGDVFGIKERVSKCVIWAALGETYVTRGNMEEACTAIQAAINWNRRPELLRRMEELN